MKPICLSLLMVTGTLLGARGEDFRTDVNPALLYYRALLMPVQPISDSDWNYLASKKGKEQRLPERFGKTVAGYDHQFQLVRQAAHATVPCDWGIDLSPGPNIHLPHLARLKALSRTAQLRAVWALEHGRQEDARDELLAAFVLGRNVASDGLLISAWVQFSIEALDYGTLAQHFGEFSPETLRQVVQGFDAAPALHTIAGCLATDKACTYDWLVRKILDLQKAHPHDDAKVMAGIHDSYAAAMEFIGETNFWPRLIAASGGTSEGVLKLLRELEPLYPRLARIMSLPQPEYEIQAEEFSAEIQKSPNPFLGGVKAFFTGFVLGGGQKFQCRPAEFRIQAQLAMVRAAVEYRLHGESGLKSVTDPFGNGPLGFRRFIFKGVDRGFELKSAYAGANGPFAMIFVEKPGSPFEVSGPDAGKAMDQ